MGNNPSSASKPASPSPHHTLSLHHNNHQRGGDQNQNDSFARPVPVRREVKHPIPVSHQRIAAPPEPSLAQAQGTTAGATSGNANSNNNNNHNARRRSLQPRTQTNISSSQSTPASSVTSASARPVHTKSRPDARAGKSEYEPARPVAVPHSTNSPPVEQRSPWSEVGVEAATMPHSSIQDISYLTRPPRLPLPIEQEIHTPGSPIIAPADLGEPVDDLDGPDAGETLARRSSGLSTATLDEDDDTEELRVDKNRPSVPLTLDWHHGGSKVYVTGTIFQWNRKTRMVPM